MSYLFVALTIAFTVYGQLVLKWQTSLAPPSTQGHLVAYVVAMLLRPWVLSGLAAAFLASACWIAAVSRLPLSKAYPFMALNFVLVAVLAVPFFGEPLSIPKLTGLGLVVAGLIVISHG
ncbi:EamA family transporter [Frateuria sp. GZRe12]|uniref:EamA family transporter n=1 Tax=Frateuria sp. GZRe12 TaxID=3351533 RepID=UPI003EDB71FA